MLSPYKKDILSALEMGFLPIERLEGKSVLLTGATGLIGGAVGDMILEGCPGARLTVTGRSAERLRKRFPSPKVDILELDLSKKSPRKAFDFIIHAAGYANPALYASSPVEVMTLNYNSLVPLLEAIRKNPGSRLLYVSSDEVYGETGLQTIEESDSGYVDCTRPRSCYPSSKRHCETLCAAYADEYGVDVVTVRPSHVYGPYYTEGDNRAYAQFLRNVLNGEDVILKSQGEQMRSWCYSVDCASAILAVLLSGAKGEAYNIADNTSAFTIRDLATMTAKAGGQSVGFDLPPELEKKGYNPVRRSVISTKKLESLGRKPVPGTPETKIASTYCTQKNYSLNGNTKP